MARGAKKVEGPSKSQDFVQGRAVSRGSTYVLKFWFRAKMYTLLHSETGNCSLKIQDPLNLPKNMGDCMRSHDGLIDSGVTALDTPLFFTFHPFTVLLNCVLCICRISMGGRRMRTPLGCRSYLYEINSLKYIFYI